MKSLLVLNANYVSEYKIHIYFNDGTDKMMDFEDYLFNHEHTYPEYRKLSMFKTFRVDKGELVWGKNWDIIFPVHKLHKGKIITTYPERNSEPFLVFDV